MERIHKYILIFVVFTCVMTSCSIQKFLPSDQSLYLGPEISYDHKSKIVKEEVLTEKIQENLYPNANSKLLGIFYFRLWVYFRFQSNHDRGISKFLYEQFAEEPVYVSDIDRSLSESIVQKSMQDFGYFKSKVSSEIINTKPSKAKVKYEIEVPTITKITSVKRVIEDEAIDSLLSNYKAFWVRKGNRYRTEDFTIERQLIAEYIRSFGYYSFNQQDVIYFVDTSTINQVNVQMQLKYPEKDSTYRKYYIRKIDVYPTFTLEQRKTDSILQHKQYKGLSIHEAYRFINEKTLNSNIVMEPGDLFSVEDYNISLNRLINLNIFKYVNIQYKEVGFDSLDVEIQLTPTQYKSIEYDVELSTSDRSILGSSLVGSFNNYNALLRAEKTSISARIGSEVQSVNQNLRFSILNANLEFRHEIPRLLVPFPVKRFRSAIVPKTTFVVKENFQLWTQYFTANTVNLTWEYAWNTDKRGNHILEPAFFNLTNLFSTTSLYDSIVIANPSIGLSYADNFILGTKYTYSYSSPKRHQNHFSLRASTESSGSIVNSISDFMGVEPRIVQAQISQFVKLDLDYHFTRDFTSKEAFVFRAAVGQVFAYGNSTIAPFTRRYFIGGASTLRGFGFQSIGPGRNTSIQGNSSLANPIDQAGDIRLLLNAEYRFPIYSVFRGALFMDAGNVWLFEENPDIQGGTFKWDSFYKELAFNSGLGLRLDFSYIVLRGDIGIPFYTPYEMDGNRWIHQNPETGLWNWMGSNLVLSGGIGYPF